MKNSYVVFFTVLTLCTAGGLGVRAFEVNIHSLSTANILILFGLFFILTMLTSYAVKIKHASTVIMGILISLSLGAFYLENPLEIILASYALALIMFIIIQSLAKVVEIDFKVFLILIIVTTTLVQFTEMAFGYSGILEEGSESTGMLLLPFIGVYMSYVLSAKKSLNSNKTDDLKDL